jgi:hypothetical protein
VRGESSGQSSGSGSGSGSGCGLLTTTPSSFGIFQKDHGFFGSFEGQCGVGWVAGLRGRNEVQRVRCRRVEESELEASLEQPSRGLVETVHGDFAGRDQIFQPTHKTKSRETTRTKDGETVKNRFIILVGLTGERERERERGRERERERERDTHSLEYKSLRYIYTFTPLYIYIHSVIYIDLSS